jgi:outer membrane protein TolC
MSVEFLKSVFDVAAVVLLFLTFAAGAGVLITGNIINTRQEQKLRTFDHDLTIAKSDLTTQIGQVAGLQLDASNAKAAQQQVEIALEQQRERTANAEVELSRLTGPPHLVPVKHGVAIPDLSAGNKQVVLVSEDTRIILPKLPKEKSLSWTLILTQDGVGQHQFTFSPQLSGFGNYVLDSPPHSSWLVNLVTDSSGTVNVGLGGTFAAAPIGTTSSATPLHPSIKN